MRILSNRLAKLERAAQPPKKLVIYAEDLHHRGMFRRGAGWRGRADLPPLLTREQMHEDAAGAICVVIEYESGKPAGDTE